MIMQCCAVYDKKVGAYTAPQFFRSKGEAMRAFVDACQAEDAPFRKHAEDYFFSRLCEYDDVRGSFSPAPEGPEVLLTALDAVNMSA